MVSGESGGLSWDGACKGSICGPDLFAQAGDAASADLPGLVKDEFDAVIACGILAHGLLRLHCGDCGHDELVEEEDPTAMADHHGGSEVARRVPGSATAPASVPWRAGPQRQAAR